MLARGIAAGALQFDKVQAEASGNRAQHRLSLRATVARGSEWLAESHFANVLKERASDGMIVHGPISFDNAVLEDFVILRSDRQPTYHLSVVSDDIDMACGLVVSCSWLVVSWVARRQPAPAN